MIFQIEDIPSKLALGSPSLLRNISNVFFSYYAVGCGKKEEPGRRGKVQKEGERKEPERMFHSKLTVRKRFIYTRGGSVLGDFFR